MKTILSYILAVLSACFVASLIEGCIPPFSNPSPPHVITEPNTPQQILYRTVYKPDLIITSCTVGVGLCITAFLLGSKWALFGVVGCLATLGMRLATVRYAGWLAGASVVCAIVLCVWVVLTRKKALNEIIKNVQDYKGSAPYGSGIRDFLAKQSRSTQTIVKEIKKNLS